MLGKNIRYLRTQANYSQDKLAELLGYKSFTTIQKWESGVSNPPFSTVKKISELFHVDIDTLNSTDLSIKQDKIELMDNYFGINKSDLVEKRDQDKITNDVDHEIFLKLNESNAEILIEISRLNPENHEKLAKYIHSLLQTQILENELKNGSNNN